jgi:outer membrane lipoprotein-sorting protein
MKYAFSLFILSSIIFSATLFAQAEQSDPAARQLLEEVASQFESMDHYKLNFEMLIQIPESEEQRFKGVFFGAGEKYKLDMPSRQIFCDGTSVWMYEKAYNEAQLYSKKEIEESESVTPYKMIHIYENEDYVYALVFEDSTKKMIEFKPKSRESEIVKMRLELNSENHIKSIKTFFNDATRYELILGNLSSLQVGENVKFHLDEKDFPGVYVEDLRME